MKTLFKLALLILTVLVVLAFTGFEPLAGYKDVAIDGWDGIVDNTKSNLVTTARVNRESSHPLPVTLSLTESHAVGKDLVIDIVVSLNERTEIGTSCQIRCADLLGNITDGVWLVRFNLGQQEYPLTLQLPSDVSEKLLQRTAEYANITALLKERESAEKRLTKAQKTQDEFWYNYSTGKSLPDYDAVLKADQEFEDALQAVKTIESEIVDLVKAWSGVRRIDSISLKDVLPYLRVEML